MNTKIITGVVVAIIALTGLGAAAFMQRDKDAGSSGANYSTDKSGSGGESGEPEQQPNTVTYKDFAVEQPAIKVKKGTTVTWLNEDTAKHDVTPVNETSDFKASKLFGKGESYEVTFNTTGTFEYFCSPHPYMKGTIEVVE